MGFAPDRIDHGVHGSPQALGLLLELRSPRVAKPQRFVPVSRKNRGEDVRTGRTRELHCAGAHVPSGALNQHTVTRAHSRVTKEHLSGSHRDHRHRGRFEEVTAAGLCASM